MRDDTLDALRGLTVFGMGFVNLQGAAALAFAPFVHAEWHGMTAADLVFPFFLLVVGLAIPLALDRPGAAPTWGKLLRRAALLIAIGIALNWLIRPSALEDLRLTGVLQRIGVVYLACAAVAMLSRGYRVALIGATGLLVAHGVCLLVIAAPGAAAPSLAPGLGLSGWLDQVALPGRVLRKTYDPEGVLSTLSAIASGLIGVATMRWLNRAEAPPTNRTREIAIIAGGLLVAGALSMLWLPLNKPLWTPSFALVTAGLGLASWAVLRAAWPLLESSLPARGLVVLGKTALTLYVLQLVLIAVLVRKLPDGERLWDAGFHALTHAGMSPPWASLVFAAIGSAICVAPMAALLKRGWLIRA
jgi:predicted acyltransferase